MLVAVLIASFLMILLGGLVGGPHRLREMDLISGWAIAGTVLVLVGVTSSLPLTMVLYGLCVVALLSGIWLYRREGRLADIAILTMDILAAEPEEIANARVARTLVGGRVVFCAYGTPGEQLACGKVLEDK